METTIYNPANKRKDQLINEFVIRTKHYESIIKDIRSSTNKFPGQHYILVGQRGSGKTTLIHRIKYGIEDDKKLKDILPIALGEEQYGVIELVNLWEKIAEILDDYFGFENLYESIILEIEKSNNEEKCFDIIEYRLIHEKKSIVLFIDNFGDLIQKFSDIEIKRMREILTTSASLRLIAASPILIDEILDYQKPLFEFFKTVSLKGLNNKEIEILLLKLSEVDNSTNKIENIIKNNPERIQILRLLTGGVTRTIVSLYKILIDNANGTSIKDLQLTLDAVTPLYKHKMDDLPKNQQKIIDSVARSWDAASVKDIVKTTRIESKKVSAQLRQLEKSQFIEKITTSNKNNLYQIKERFFNIWYLMRYGRKYEKNRVIWLVRFLESWCSKEDLENRVNTLIDSLKTNNWDGDVISLLGEAYLSCTNISIDLKEKLVISSQKALPNHLTKGMSVSDSDILETVKQYLSQEDFINAKKYLLKINNQEKVYEILTVLSACLNEHLDTLKYSAFLISSSKKISGDFFSIRGNAKTELGDIEGSISEYTKAIELDHHKSIIYIAQSYLELDKVDDAIKFLKNGLNLINIKGEAAHDLAHIYDLKNNEIEAERYFKVALDNGEEKAKKCLGIFYSKNDKNTKAIKIFEDLLESDFENASIYLAILYNKEGEKEKAIKLLNDIEKSNSADVQLKIAQSYHHQLNDFKKAKKHYKLSLELGNKNGFKGLGAIYEKEGDVKKVEEFYLEIHKKTSDDYVLLYLADFYKRNKVNKMKALELVKNIRENQNFDSKIEILYSLTLLWNNQLEQSVLIINNLLSNLNKDEFLSEILDELNGIIEYFIQILKLKFYDISYDLIMNNNLKDVLKPIYYVIIYFLEGNNSKEFLKMGEELKEVVHEIINHVEND